MALAQIIHDHDQVEAEAEPPADKGGAARTGPASGGPCETIEMQRNPEELFDLSPAVPDIADAPILLYLEGFIDAGNAAPARRAFAAQLLP